MPDLPASSNDDTPPARRRLALAALLGLAAAGSAQAQMGGPGGGGGGPGGGGPGGSSSRPDKAKDSRSRGAGEPRDLIAAFARRLREGLPELAITPAQQGPWHSFVASLSEVGQHNERRLQRILFHSASSFSATSPWRSYLGAEVDEGEGRQQALAELKLAWDKLDATLDERQRGALNNLFVVVRGEVQAPPGGDRD